MDIIIQPDPLFILLCSFFIETVHGLLLFLFVLLGLEIIKNIFVSMKIGGTNSRLLSTPPWNEAFDHFQHFPHQSRLVFLMAPPRPIENQVSKF